MHFASDNAGPVHPQIMQALADTNSGYAMGYGNDPLTAKAIAAVRDVFEAPNAEVFFVTSGTGANALALSCLAKPVQAVFCSPVAHVFLEECNAVEFFTGGARLTPVPGDERMDPAALRDRVEFTRLLTGRGPQIGAVTLTQVTEFGTLYSLDDIHAVAAVAADFGLPLHLDGARFANAVARLGCSPADMTWKAGVDAISFGGTKNGCMGLEAVVIFDPERAQDMALRRKRGGHLWSKHRYLSAQMEAYLRDDLWLETARQANAHSDHLAAGMRAAGVTFAHEPMANLIFVKLSRAEHRRLHAAGAVYYIEDGTLDGPDDTEMLTGRFVCGWSQDRAEIDRFLAVLSA